MKLGSEMQIIFTNFKCKSDMKVKRTQNNERERGNKYLLKMLKMHLKQWKRETKPIYTKDAENAIFFQHTNANEKILKNDF